MSKYERFVSWIDSYRDVAFDLLRIYLGIGLLVRGVLFLAEPASYTVLVDTAPGWLTSTGLYYTVALTHVVAGAMMAAGLLTRVAALVQIPILLGAVFVVHFQGGLITASQSFEFSALVLFLLVLVFLHGSGRWGLDQRWDHGIRPFQGIAERLNASEGTGMALLRIYLGVGLFVRGAVFITNSQAFIELVGSSPSDWLTSVVLVHYITLAHLIGGAMMAVGLLTRVAALVQIPILLGAVFVVHFQGGLIAPSQSFEFSTLVLFLLVLFFLYGSGQWSLDRYILAARTETEPAGPSPRARAILDEAATMAPPTVAPEGAVITAAPSRTQVAPRPPAQAVQFCSLKEACPVVSDADPRTDPHTTATVRYGTLGMFYFLFGITGPPKEVIIRCDRCGRVVKRSRSPDDLNHYRYRS